MNKYLAICILTIVTFLTLTISTAKTETAFDGNNSYGFPLTFFTSLGGKRFPTPTSGSELFYVNLLFDVTVAVIIAFLIWTIYTTTRKISQRKNAAR